MVKLFNGLNAYCLSDNESKTEFLCSHGWSIVKDNTKSAESAESSARKKYKLIDCAESSDEVLKSL